MSQVPANDIYPTLPQGVVPSTALNSYQLTLSRQEQAIFNYVSTVNVNTGAPVQFRSYDEYIKYKLATYANRSNPN
jgi:hypothetical protein